MNSAATEQGWRLAAHGGSQGNESDGLAFQARCEIDLDAHLCKEPERLRRPISCPAQAVVHGCSIAARGHVSWPMAPSTSLYTAIGLATFLITARRELANISLLYTPPK